MENTNSDEGNSTNPDVGSELGVKDDNAEDWETEDGSSDDEDEEDDDDESSEDSGEETEDYEFEEEEEAGETCPICLDRLRDQDLGTPESCDHTFCLECIQEWSKNVNTCPVDRQVFHLIFAKHPGEDTIFKSITVADKEQGDPDEEEDPIFCEACGRSDREDRLLLCDGCDLGYHCECLNPPLAEVPAEEWYCPDCEALREREREGAAALTVSDDDEISYIIQENDVLPHSLRPRVHRRQVARTRMSERIYQQIREIRRSRFNRRMIILSDSESSSESENSEDNYEIDEDAPSTSSAPAPRRKPATRRKKKKTTTRKTKGKRKSTGKGKRSAGKTKGKKPAKRKTKGRRTKRKTRRTKKSTGGKKGSGKRKIIRRVMNIPEAPITTAKSRIAKNLGLSKPPPGRTLPLQKRPKERAEDYGHAPLSIMGTPNDLFYFHDENDNQPSTSGYSDSGKKSKPSANIHFSVEEIMKRRPVVRLSVDTSLRFRPQEEPAPVSSSIRSTESPCDLLGSIFQGQQMLHMKTEKIKIHRDGSLSAMKSSSDPKDEGTKSLNESQVSEGTTESEGATDDAQPKESSPDTEQGEGGASGKFLRLPIFAGSSNVELDDSVEIPEEPAETSEKEDDGLGDSLWTIQKRQEKEDVEHQGTTPNSSKLFSANTASDRSQKTDRKVVTTDNQERMDTSIEKDHSRVSKSEEGKLKSEKDSLSGQTKSPGKGKDSKSRNYRSKHTFINASKSSTELYSDIEDDIDLPISSSSSSKSSQKDSEKSKKHSETKEKSSSSETKEKSSSSKRQSSSDKSDPCDLFDDRTQDSVSDSGKLDNTSVTDFKLEKSPKLEVKRPALDDVRFEYEDSNDSVPSTSWSDAGVGSAIITEKEYNDKKWRVDKIRYLDREMDCKNISSKRDRKSPKGSKRRSESKGSEQDAGLLITVAGNSEDRSVAEKTEKNIELLGQRLSRNTESTRRSSKEGKEKSAAKSRSRLEEASKREEVDYHRSKSHKHRSRSRSRERKRRSRSRDRRERTRSRDRRDRSRSRDRRERSRSRDRWERSRSRDRRERSRSRDRRDRSRSRDRRERSRSRERYDGYRSGERTRRSRERRDRSRSIEFKSRERRDRSRSKEKRERSRSKERKERSRSRDRRKSRRDRSLSIEQRRERSRSPDGRRSRSLERPSKKAKSEKRRERDSKSSRSPYRRESEDRSHLKEEKLDLFSSGIKRLHDGKGKKAKKLRTTLTEPIVILSDDEQDHTPRRKSENSYGKPKSYLEDKISNRIEPIITPRSSTSHRSKDSVVVEEPPLPTEELSLPPMPPMISNVKVLTDARETKKEKRHLKEVVIEENVEKEETQTETNVEKEGFDFDDDELAYDPAFPTVDMEESPIESPSDVEEAAEPIHLHLHKDFSMQRISPLPGPPPPPMPGQGLLGEPSILLPSSAGEPPQPLLQGPGQQIPLQIRMLPPGFHGQQAGGLPPQRQLIVNHPMFINRPGSFPHIQQIPAGHPIPPRLVSTPAGMVTVQNQFSPRIPSLVSLSGQPGLINGALDHLSHDPPLILTSDPRGDPRLHHPPHPESHVISIRPEVPVVPMTVSESIPLSVSSSEALNQSDIIPSVSQLEQISQITKLLNTQAQLAMLGKEPKGLEHASHKQEPMEQKNTNSVFKVPLPPILTHTINKVKSEKENMEMVDMDMSSPQDNGNIEIPTSSSEKSERSRRRDKKRSRRHRSGERHRDRHEDRVSSTVESQKSFDQIMEDMNNADEIPSSAVELTNKEKYLKKLHLQERVVDEVKTALKPFYSAKKVNKEQYKEILRRAVPKVCHSKSGDINPVKIRALVDAYVAKFNRNMSPPNLENGEQTKKKS